MSTGAAQRLKSMVAAFSRDPDALFEARQLVLGLVIIAGVAYGLYAFLLLPRQVQLHKKQEQRRALTTVLGSGELEQMTGQQLEQLVAANNKAKAMLEEIRFRKGLYLEQFQNENVKKEFSDVVFTLLPDSPVDIAGEFMQMTVMDARSFELFDVYPVNIQGHAEYSEFMTYLRYLERRSEVGAISDLELEQFSPEMKSSEKNQEPVKAIDAFAEPVLVHFSLVLGRVQLR